MLCKFFVCVFPVLPGWYDLLLMGHIGPTVGPTAETYVPRASTPLLDAMGRGINDLDSQLAAMDTTDRPERIVFVVVTDGHENASREFSRADILRMVEQHKARGWQFVFLGADLIGFDEARRFGLDDDVRLCYRKDERGVRMALSTLADKVMDYRAKRVSRVVFDEADRAAQDEFDDPKRCVAASSVAKPPQV